MGMVFGLALILFTAIWECTMWQERTSLFGAPWQAPYQTMHDPPRVTFSKKLAEEVEALRTAGEGARGKKMSQQDVYQGKGKKPDHARARKAWKKWIAVNAPFWKLTDTVDRTMKENGFDLTSMMKLSKTREVSIGISARCMLGY